MKLAQASGCMGQESANRTTSSDDTLLFSTGGTAIASALLRALLAERHTGSLAHRRFDLPKR